MAEDQKPDITGPFEANPQQSPIPNWDRYELQELLGQGSMGQVYRAFDPRLRRLVAIKFIHNATDSSIRRFMQEAQAQARIDHENICKVYEVGEVSGKHFVCMQYIDGKTLKDCQDSLSMDQKIEAVRQAAEAIHEAHRLGLIHRDIKPSNIMIEEKQGVFRSYVLDFGLVRQLEAETLTRTGEVLGTPAYMSPEQAAGGELHELDRRTDVYSLGASLYDLLARRPAFQGPAMDVLIQVLEKDPLPLRKAEPKVPKDLETIVMKCMEKEAHRRYDSARAVAEDLKHYLNGESISASPASVMYRWVRKAKRHKTVTALLSSAMLLVLLFSGISIYTQRQSATRAVVAQHFGQEVQKIESLLRNSYTLPLHDVRQDNSAVRSQVRRIEKEMESLGGIAAGPGNYALGRGHLLLGEYDLALKHLQKALGAGYEPPEVSYALGQTYGYLYLKALRDTGRIKISLLRQARLKQNERDFRLPALSYLKKGSGALIDSSAYVEGLIAFHEKKYPLALQRAEAAFQQVRWLYEAKKLQGDILVTRATERQNAGDSKAALEDVAEAGKAYRLAMEVGRSDPVVYESECNRLVQELHNSVRRGETGEVAFSEMRSACDRALRVNPDNGEVYKGLAGAYWRWADQRREIENPDQILQRAVDYSNKAIRLLPEDDVPYDLLGCAYWIKAQTDVARERNPQASVAAAEKACLLGIKINPNCADCYNTMGNADSMVADYQLDHGGDPTASFNRTITAYENAIRIDPNYAYVFNNIGNIYYRKGRYDGSQSRDPIPSYTKAIESYRKAVKTTTSYAHVFYNGIGATHSQIMQYYLQKGKDPAKSIDASIAALTKSLEFNPQYNSALVNLGLAYWGKGLYESFMDKDPRKSYDISIGYYQKCIELTPQNEVTYKTLAHTYLDLADFEIRHDIDPLAHIEKGKAAVAKTLELAPGDFEGLRNRGGLELAAAKWAIRAKASPEKHFNAAESSLKAAFASNANGDNAMERLAELYLIMAEWKWNRKQNAEKEIESGFDAVNRGLKVDPENAQTIGVRGELYMLQAKMASDQNKRSQFAVLAKQSFEKAVSINSFLKKDYDPKLQEAATLSQPSGR